MGGRKGRGRCRRRVGRITHKGKELWGRSETVHTLLLIFALILFPSKLVPLKQPVLEGVASEVALTAYP